jgi:hypothetical protein
VPLHHDFDNNNEALRQALDHQEGGDNLALIMVLFIRYKVHYHGFQSIHNQI